MAGDSRSPAYVPGTRTRKKGTGIFACLQPSRQSAATRSDAFGPRCQSHRRGTAFVGLRRLPFNQK